MSASMESTDDQALTILFQIDPEYDIGNDKHNNFCYLAKSFVDGPSRNDIGNKKLSAMKRLFENQVGKEAISLMCMMLSDCGDPDLSASLMKFATSPFAGKTVNEEKRESYNFRRLLVDITNNLESDQLGDMVTRLQQQLQCRKSLKTPAQTLLLLFERAWQRNTIMPQKLDQLKQWLSVVEREDLKMKLIDRFDPKKQFPGYKQTQGSSADSGFERQCSDSTGQMSATVPGPAQSTGAVGPLTKNPSVDSAYAEGDLRSRSASHGDQPSVESYGGSERLSKLRTGSKEEEGPFEVAQLVSGMQIK